MRRIMHTANWEWKRLLRDWKTRLLLLAFFLFYASFPLLFQQQNLAFPEDGIEKEYQQILSLFNTIPPASFTGESGQEVYDLLADQQRLFGLQNYILSKQTGNTVPNWEGVLSNYLDNGMQITRNYSRLLELEDFEYYEYLQRFLPSEAGIQRDVAFYDYLEKHNLDIEWNSYSASSIFLEEVNLIIGFSLFLFVALLGSDRFTKDQTHYWSITQGVPIPWRKQWYVRTSQLWLVMWAATLAGLLAGYLIALTQESPGSLWYPIMIYAPGGYFPLATWQYSLLALCLGMVLSFLLLLLTVGLSWMIRTVYLTIVITLGLSFVPTIWQSLTPLTSWQPSLYLRLEPVLTGRLAEDTGLAGITAWKALVAYLVVIGLLQLIFNYVFDRIQTQTLGLQRRQSHDPVRN